VIATLHSLGFTAGNPDDLFDKGRAPDYVVYLTRRHGQPAQHQYLTLTHYDGRFVEACFWVHSEPWNPRAKKRQVPLYSNLLRSAGAVLEAVTRTYPPV
jgi:hypothetical protein